MNFSQKLLDWYSFNKRQLPWRKTQNPYFIWLSEIILQQTRVEQGLPYYLKFIKTFPTLLDLASANEDKILKLWQGLGYYSRARNLHFSAKYIIKYHDGFFPKEYSEILALKGVGVYTAAAISSFSFGLPYAVVDGNVIRVLSRFFGIDDAYDSSLGKKKYHNLAQKLLDQKKPAEHNQAIMEFGALQCTPKSPKCSVCIFASECVAYNLGSVYKFPVKIKKIKIKKRFIHYLLIKNDNAFLIGKRNTGIWRGLYDFPFLEYSRHKTEEAIILSNQWIDFFANKDYKINSVSDVILHKLTHQHIYAKFWTIDIDKIQLDNYIFVHKSELLNYPFSRLIDKFLKDYNIN